MNVSQPGPGSGSGGWACCVHFITAAAVCKCAVNSKYMCLFLLTQIWIPESQESRLSLIPGLWYTDGSWWSSAEAPRLSGSLMNTAAIPSRSYVCALTTMSFISDAHICSCLPGPPHWPWPPPPLESQTWASLGVGLCVSVKHLKRSQLLPTLYK